MPKKIPEDAKNYKMTYVDATCPLVSKVHREAENLNKAGYHIILIGHENHPEVVGTMGQLPDCLLYTSPSPRDYTRSRMPSSA